MKNLKRLSTFLAIFLFSSMNALAKILLDNGLPFIDTRVAKVDFSHILDIFKTLTIPLIIITVLLEFPIFYFTGCKSKKKIRTIALTVILMSLTTLILAHSITYIIEELAFNYFQTSFEQTFYEKLNIIILLTIVIIKGITFKLITKEISWKRSILISLLATLSSIIIILIIIKYTPYNTPIFQSNYSNLHHFDRYIPIP